MTLNRTMTSAITATLLALGLAACSDNGPSEAPTSSAPASTAGAAATGTDSSTDSSTDTSTDTSTDSGAAAAGGGWSVNVGGEEISLPGAEVYCTEAAGVMSIAIVSTSSTSEGFAIQLSTGDAPEVQAVGLIDSAGNALAYSAGSPMGSASATKDGNTYEVTGEGIVTDINNPTSMDTKPFDVTVTCG